MTAQSVARPIPTPNTKNHIRPAPILLNLILFVVSTRLIHP